MQAIFEFLARACCYISRTEFCEPYCARRAAASTTATTTTDEWAAFAADCVGIDRTMWSGHLPASRLAYIPIASRIFTGCRKLYHCSEGSALQKPMKAEDIVDLKFLPAPINAM